MTVLVGLAATLGLFVALGELVMRYTAIDQVQWHSSPQYTWAGLATNLFRLLFSVSVGGFIASWISRRAALWHAAAVGACLLAPIVFQGVPDAYIQPVWYSVLSLVLIIPAGLLGGRGAVWFRRNAG